MWLAHGVKPRKTKLQALPGAHPSRTPVERGLRSRQPPSQAWQQHKGTQNESSPEMWGLGQRRRCPAPGCCSAGSASVTRAGCAGGCRSVALGRESLWHRWGKSHLWKMLITSHYLAPSHGTASAPILPHGISDIASLLLSSSLGPILPHPIPLHPTRLCLRPGEVWKG